MRGGHSDHFSGRRRLLTLPAAVIEVLALGVAALALSSSNTATAAHVARLDVTPAQVAPGGQVTVSSAPSGGFGDADVTVRWDSLDGPVLGTFPSDPFGPETVTIPADATPGRHVLIADQVVGEEGTGVRGIPARAAIDVIGPGGEVPDAVQAPSPAALPHVESLAGDGANLWVLATIAVLAFVAAVAAGAAVARRGRVATERD